MKLLPLALILIIIFAVYYVKFIRTKSLIEIESFNNDKINETRKKFADKDFEDYDSIINPTFNGADKITSFFKLKAREGYGNLKLVDTRKGTINKPGELKNEMEKCSLMTTCSESDEHPNCGYCFPLNKFMYGNETGPIVDGQLNKHNICPSLKNGQPGWVPPPKFGKNPSTKDECTRMNAQELCEKAGRTCSAPDGNGAVLSCGWCPKSQKFMVKELVGNKYLPKYREKSKWKDSIDVCEWEGLEDDGTVSTNNNLISDKAECIEFQKKFPCVTKNAASGPHTAACYSKLWKKTKCSGNDPISRSAQMNSVNQKKYGKQIWDKSSWRDSLAIMKSIYNKVKNEEVYDVAVDLNKACFDSKPPIDSCDEKYKPRPQECSKRIYKEEGCKTNGYLEPDNVKRYYEKEILDSTWKDNMWRNITNRKYKEEIRKHKLQSRGVGKGQQYSYRRRSSQYCGEKIPDPPNPKPCWSDMKRILSIMPSSDVKTNKDYIILNTGSPILQLLKSSSGGKYPNIIETTSDKIRAETRIAFQKKNGKYYFHEKTLGLKEFPYWDILKVCKDYWNTNWDKFGKTLAYKTPFVNWKNTHITVTKGSGFTKLLGKSTNKNTALTNGLFYDDSKSNDVQLWKKSYEHKDFPYWDFLILITTMTDNTLNYKITN